MSADLDLTVLLVAPSGEQAERLGLELEAATESLSVTPVDDPGEARRRLAWPDIDCLVCVPGHRQFDWSEFLASVRADHPLLPLVYYGPNHTPLAEDDDDFEVVIADGPDSIPSLVGAVMALSEAQQRRREQYTLDSSGSVVEYPNVTEAHLDALLQDGVERETLRELVHKSQLLDAILETLPVHLYVKDRHARHRYISNGYFEEDIDQFIGKAEPEMDMIAPDHAWRAFEEDMYVIETGEAIIDKEEYVADRDEWNLTSKVPWRDADGETVGLLGVTRDITTRKRREAEIRRQNERLETFSEMVSHDLRNPLQVAQSALELAIDENDSDRLEMAADALGRMDEMIGEVLALARYGRTVVEMEPVDLDDTVLAAWSTAGDNRGTLDVVGDLGTVRCDPNQIQRLLENLFRNAVEHGCANPDRRQDAGEPGSTDSPGVTVTVEPLRSDRGEPGGGFAVEDDGPGIPEADREKILEMGYSTATEGTGLGLAIVSEIVEAHGWELSVTEGATGGARFEVRNVDQD